MPLLLCLLWLLCPITASAGGFAESLNPVQVTSATQVYSAPPGSPCSLEGRIIQRIPGRRDQYLFQDESGQVMVMIPHHVFGGFTVTPQLLVQLNGRVRSFPWQPNVVQVNYLGIIGPAASFGLP